jgi:hypothetical protein
MDMIRILIKTIDSTISSDQPKSIKSEGVVLFGIFEFDERSIKK